MGALEAASRVLSGSVVSINRIAAFFSPGAGLHTSRFARLHELAPLLSPIRKDLQTSLLLGRSSFNQLACVRPTHTRRELGNLLVCSPTRGGKGLLAVSQLLCWPHSVVVNDIKGELFTQTAGYRSTLGRVFVIDPQGLGHAYDPLNERRTEDALYSSAAHLLFQAEEGEGRIFTQRATTMLQQIFLASRREGIAPFPYVRFLIQLGLSETAWRLSGAGACARPFPLGQQPAGLFCMRGRSKDARIIAVDPPHCAVPASRRYLPHPSEGLPRTSLQATANPLRAQLRWMFPRDSSSYEGAKHQALRPICLVKDIVLS